MLTIGFNPLVPINAMPIKLNKEINNQVDEIDYPSSSDTLNKYLASGNFGEEPNFVPGEIIIKFRDEIKNNAKIVNNCVSIGSKITDKLNVKYNIKSFEKLSVKKDSIFSNVYKFIIPQKSDILSIIDDYRNDPKVEYAEPNYIYHTFILPNDPYFINGSQWALEKIDAPEAWNIETGRSDIVIAVIDTGVDYNHPDLKENIWANDDEIPSNGVDDDNNGFVDDIRGWDFVNNDNDPIDDNGHGTHCAGIIGAIGNNSIGVAGVCWNCSILPIKALNSRGKGCILCLANNIVYATDNGADVISMSIGGSSKSKLFEEALDYAHSKGVTVVAAAGNDNTYLDFIPMYPAAYSNVIAVAATDENDEKAKFSNYGSLIDVAAPGVGILSTMPTYHVTLNDKGYSHNYDTLSGTSMACPHVAGLAGLIISKKPDCNPDEIRTILHSGIDNVFSDRYIGVGRINANKILQKNNKVTAKIDGNFDDLIVNKTVIVKGTVKGDFSRYIVEYGKGYYPDNWTEIYNSTDTVENDAIALWNTRNCDENIYTLRIKTICENESYEDRANMIVNNVQNTVYVDDDAVGFEDGTKDHPYQYIRYAIEYAVGTNDIIYVFSGEYKEKNPSTYPACHGIILGKKINLLGEDKNSVINDEIALLCDKIKISGFTFNAGISIYSSYNEIVGNTITAKIPHAGIGLIIGFYIDVEYVTIETFYSQATYGNIITNNTITKTLLGIGLFFTAENKIYHNNFIDNFEQVRFVYFTFLLSDFPNIEHLSFSKKNIWNENYWDDWIGLKCKIFQKFPKCLKGEIQRVLLFVKLSKFKEKQIGIKLLGSRYEFDWHPLSEPYVFEEMSKI